MADLKRNTNPYYVILLCILVFGIAVRVGHLLLVDTHLPFALGGLYLEFAQKIVDHGYALPKTIPFYTLGGIPFAYPPLPFYIEAVALDVFAVPWYAAVNGLPIVASIVALLSFVFLIRSLQINRRTELIAVAAYASMTAAFSQQVEGAGIAESFGSLTLIWAAFFLTRSYRRRSSGDAMAGGVMLGLCVLASPGSAYASLPTFVIFGSVMVTRLRAWSLVGLAGILWLAVCAPYLMIVTSNHGLHVFLSPFVHAHWGGSMGMLMIDVIARFLSFRVESGSYFLFWDALTLFGALRAMTERRWALIMWFVVLFAIPREGQWMAAIPASVFAGMGGDELLRYVETKTAVLPSEQARRMQFWMTIAVALGFIIGNLYFYFNSIPGANEVLSQDQFTVLKWAEGHLEGDQALVVMASNAALEWAPQIARRTVLNEPYGAEWQPKELDRIETINENLKNCGDLACVISQVVQTGYTAEFAVLVVG